MEEQPSGWAIGWALFAATMMVMLGFWWAFAGLVGIINKQFYVKSAKYVFQFNATTWGWVHLVVGVLVVLAGLALFRGATWARVVGIFLAMLSGFIAFAWLPWYPIWAILFIFASISVIWALTIQGREWGNR